MRRIWNKHTTHISSGSKVFVALSGGVDSAVVAYLLKKKGYEVLGGFIKGYNIDGCQDTDAQDAADVAAHLGIPFYTFDLEKEYEERVVSYLLEGYRKGITPNPDVVCNSQIKFGLFYDQAMKLGADAVASGHYAICRDGNLYEGFDANKDQSYFLWQVPRERFFRLMFPLGTYLKDEVRRIARRAKLPNAEKKDSQGICFLGKFDFNEFLRMKLGAREGDVLDTAGKVIGVHQGVHLYTIGQRHGFRHVSSRPMYVISKDIARNTLTAAFEDDDELRTDQFIVGNVLFLDDAFEKTLGVGKALRVLGRCRYHQPLFDCTVLRKGDHLLVTLGKRRVIFPAPGQSFVMYDKKKRVLGGGSISGYEV